MGLIDAVIEKYALAKYRMYEGSLSASWGSDWGYGETGATEYKTFVLNLRGWASDGITPLHETFEDQEAVEFLHTLMMWDGES